MTALKSLSDKELLARIAGLRRREHKTTLEILIHLNEIERRRLHLKLGYSSLFDYCMRRLKYSASAAGRRIQTAKCVRRYPEVFELLEKERVNLMTVSLVAGILTEGNKREILGAIQDKTQREVEAIASRYRPPVELRDRVRPVRVYMPDHSRSGSELSPSSAGSGRKCSPSRPGGGSELSPSSARSGDERSHSLLESRSEPSPGAAALSGQILSTKSMNSQCGSEKSTTYEGGRGVSARGPHIQVQQRLQVQFLADEAFMKKYEEARSLLSQRLPDTSFASVFDALMSEFLEHHSPARRKARRDKRRELRKTAPGRTQHATREQESSLCGSPSHAGDHRQVAEPHRTAELRHIQERQHAENPIKAKAPHYTAQTSQSQPASQSPSRHVPASVRDEVFVRDKGRCTFTGKTGRRCESTHALQIDHIIPFARGGPATVSNLRLLCAKHNKIAAEEVFGERFTRQFQTGELFAPQRE